MAKLIEKIYEKIPCNDICIKYSELTVKTMKITIGFYIFYMMTAISYLLNALNEETPAVVWILPGIDLGKISHLIFILSCESLYAIISMTVMGAIDVTFIMVFVNLLVISSIIKEQIIDFENTLRRRKCSEREVKQFREIIFEYIKFNELSEINFLMRME